MDIVIIGNGISGITAARYIRKLSDHKITVISSESDHFFSRTALMYIYMGHMKYEHTKPYEDWFWEKNRINLMNAHVNQINFEDQVLITDDKSAIQYDKLILALGSSPNKFGWPGQDLKGVGSLYAIQDLDTMETYSKNLKRAVIVGGGLIGIEMAEMFHSRNIPVTFLVRESSYWDMVLPKEESEMINKHIKDNHIDLRLSTELKEIVDNGNGEVEAVITNTGERIECGFVGLTAGVHPNVKWLKETNLNIEKGIVVNEFLETNVSNAYAVGDCAQIANPVQGRRPIEAVWYTGKIMGETVAYNICGNKIKYDPGIWFNSAKFIDIEYQVYGDVQAIPPEHHGSFYWENKEGNKSVRIVYIKETEQVLGFNLMGIRFRHPVCEKWIANKTKLNEVLKDLKLANFDPEFYEEYEASLYAQYQAVTGVSVASRKKRNLNQVLAFLKS